MRATFIVPMILPPVVVALIWRVLFTPDISILDGTLGLLRLPQPAWLVDPRFALWAIIVADVWEWFPFVMLMLLAALQMLPAEPLEAARRVTLQNYADVLQGKFVRALAKSTVTATSATLLALVLGVPARPTPSRGSGLQALHSSRHAFGASTHDRRGDLRGRVLDPELATQDAIHPVVVRHPESGRKALYDNPAFTVRFDGWTDEESRPLLLYLYQHAARPEFSCRFQWRPGSIAFWDNRCTWHYALNDYSGERRLTHRITIEGVPLG